MAYWVFNILPDHSRLSILPPTKGSFEAEVIVEDFDKTLRARKGDFFVTLNKNGSYNFDNYGRIVEETKTFEIPISDKDEENFSRKGLKKEDFPKKYRHTASAEMTAMHEKLDDYTYSLLAVENYAVPYNHFKRRYTSLKENDYDTIVGRLMFISRTVFGRLFNCLPRENQFEVLLALSESNQVEKLRELGFLMPINFLKEYIQEHIIESGEYIVKSNDLFKQILPNSPLTYSGLGFFDADANQIDFIENQALHFQKLFSLEFDLTLIDEITDQIRANQEIEDRFENIFKKRKWPINVSL